jgi:GH24 family phage-related lysozyme (muramidase)
MEGLTQLLVVDLLNHERNVLWFYCDNKGWVTVGVGNLVKTEDDVVRFPMVHMDGGEQATLVEKRLAWRLVHNQYREAANYVADYYRHFTTIRMLGEDSRLFLIKRLQEEFIPACRKAFPEFDHWPMSARRATVDMAFTLGANDLVVDYPTLTKALRCTRFDIAAKECHRKKSSEDASNPSTWKGRNLWTYNMYMEAA